MINKEKNKAMNVADVETKNVEIVKQPFHFAGGLEFTPITVEAETPEQAKEIWEKKRQKIN